MLSFYAAKIKIIFPSKNTLFRIFFVILHPKTTLKAIGMKRIFISMTGIITCMNLMAQTPVSFYPQENAQDINIDTHLVIVFDKTVKTGSKGIITVTDKTTRKVVDRIDMSIPAGPTEGQPKNPNAVYTPVPYIYI